MLELKAKLFQVNKLNEELIKEKEEMISQQVISQPLAVSQPVDTADLAEYMSRVSLKERNFPTHSGK